MFRILHNPPLWEEPVLPLIDLVRGFFGRKLEETRGVIYHYTNLGVKYQSE